MKNNPYYFGCAPERLGHYLFGPNLTAVKNGSSLFPQANLFSMLDGVLVSVGFKPYKVIITYFEGASYKIYSFVDYSTDTRAGSNANFFIPIDVSGYKFSYDFKEQVANYFPTLAKHYAKKKIEFTFEDEEDTLIFTS